MRKAFQKVSNKVAALVGSPFSFLFALLIVIIWATTGPIFGFSDTWQLVINTGTTIITFLMVFLIQNTQNRDAKAMHLKLDELIQSIKGARNEFINLEDLSDDELAALDTDFRNIHHEQSSELTKRLGEMIALEKTKRSIIAPFIQQVGGAFKKVTHTDHQK